MKIYVQSRGLKRDYYWVAKVENQPEEFLHSPNSIISQAHQFIESQDFSVVVFRSQDEKLLLLVTGLKSQRKDEYERKIRNSVAWIGEDKEESLLRQIAALALKNELKIDDEVIKDNSSGGFTVEWEAIERLHQVNNNLQSELPPDKSKIARISDSRKQQLAEILMKYQLPKKEGALIIVTGTKSKETLEEAKVWRGLSNDYRIPEVWQAINEPPLSPALNQQILENKVELGVESVKTFIERVERVFIILFVVVTIGGGVIGWAFLRIIIKL